ncbi:MAG: glycolate oxidase subunit GlcF [Hyphomicrobium zavarzinii]|jgi:glycolate oxidase iron-sulfur subunit|uniref:glycolate oxidase subunit GlcF n=1 Tax=Hyphomicrobium TaxID=81 RepID=UPI000382ED5D|nr:MULTISPECIES: glycolate oxidase subunit GlcF [Hyphomicrobium]MBL8847881.1 glycolate oxidase subunit GlcF [Hyphomicrobium zavarzinii]WBT39138.1 glycolate oxidase subunit GlcF [Hyphomicrobium sp. DMF-1]HML42118.1 glycolate oxidase subunit GlcF [Hyphomicrobium zavarzinii]
MQTNFTSEQLADPRVAEADRILKRCVHCGLCTAVCSTYVVLGDERDSPRGRIYLIKDMMERGTERAPTHQIRHHIDRCLSCLSCMSTCPSGVDYMHLVDLARAEIEEKTPRSFKERSLRNLLAFLIPYPRRFRLALKAAPLARPFIPLLERVGLKEVAAMLALAPTAAITREARFGGPGTAVTHSERRARVILMTGCVQPVLRPDINDATIRLLARRGVDVVVANGSGCCGAIVQHMGREAEAMKLARRNIDAWSKEINRGEIDAIIVNASGCGTTVKDYGHMMRGDPAYAERAEKISSLAKDVSEFLYEYQLGAPERWSSLRVAYHSACSLQHGQRIHDEPRALLKQAGFAVVDVPEGHICCGSAGTYNILQPEIAGQLKKRKQDHIRSTRADVVAAGNIGCMTQLTTGLDIPLVHTVELLDWAYGGPVPAGLAHLAPFVTDVPRPRRQVEDFIET